MTSQPDSSPLNRLAVVVRRIYDNDPDMLRAVPETRVGTSNGQAILRYMFGGMVCAALELEHAQDMFSELEACEGHQQLYALANEAAQFVSHNSGPRSREVNMNPVIAVINTLTTTRPSDYLNPFRHSEEFTENDLTNLEALAENLRAYNTEKVLSEDEISEMVAAVDALIESIRHKNLNPDMKDIMLEMLSELRAQMLRINIAGPEEVRKHLDQYLGKSVMAIATATNEEEQQSAVEAFKEGVDVAKKVYELVELAHKAAPMLQNTVVALSALPFPWK